MNTFTNKVVAVTGGNSGMGLAAAQEFSRRGAKVVISGRVLVDGECIDVQEGSVLRLGPTAARAWRNNSDAPLYFPCLQYRADSVIQGGTLDGQRVDGKPAWPN